jgi:sirohydrochlorin ferrochelatase
MSNQVVLRGVAPKVADKLASMQARLNKYREESKEVTAVLERSFVVGLVAGGVGYLEGRHDKKDIGEVPIAPLAALVAHGVAFALPQHADAAHAAGDSCLATYFYRTGLEMGRDRKAKEEQKAQPPNFPVYTGVYPQQPHA